MTSSEGAMLILPDGASRFELEDEKQLEEIRGHANECAIQWCRFAQKDTLYLVTGVFKSKSWTLGSFYNGSQGDEILVHRGPCDRSGTDHTDLFMYDWECEINVDDQEGPQNNTYINQTVLIKGFKMTVRWDWLPVIQRAERTEWWFFCLLVSLWSVISRRWLSRIGE